MIAGRSALPAIASSWPSATRSASFFAFNRAATDGTHQLAQGLVEIERNICQAGQLDAFDPRDLVSGDIEAEFATGDDSDLVRWRSTRVMIVSGPRTSTIARRDQTFQAAFWMGVVTE